MVSLLLIISFLLHIIALFAIYQLFQQIQSLKNQENSQDVMELLEVYLEEIKAENKELQELLSKQQKNNQNLKAKKATLESTMQEQINDSKQIEADSEELRELDAILSTYPGYEVDTSLESKVLQLYDSGMRVEEIAQTLECGKTEAELIIKLYQKQ